MPERHRSRHGVAILQLTAVVITTAMVIVVMMVVGAAAMMMVMMGVVVVRRRWCSFHVVGRRHWTHGRFFALSQFAFHVEIQINFLHCGGVSWVVDGGS